MSEDQWRLEGCPENGPSLAVGQQGRVFVLWPTLVKESAGETLRLFLSSTTDGRRFTERTPRRVRVARGRPDTGGQTRFDALDIGKDGEGSYPALTVTPDHVVVAWTTRGASSTPLRVLRLPIGPDRRR